MNEMNGDDDANSALNIEHFFSFIYIFLLETQYSLTINHHDSLLREMQNWREKNMKPNVVGVIVWNTESFDAKLDIQLSFDVKASNAVSSDPYCRVNRELRIEKRGR